MTLDSEHFFTLCKELSLPDSMPCRSVSVSLSCCLAMGWLRLVGSLKLRVSFAKEPYKRDPYSPKRRIILRSLLIVATPYLRQDMGYVSLENIVLLCRALLQKRPIILTYPISCPICCLPWGLALEVEGFCGVFARDACP